MGIGEWFTLFNGRLLIDQEKRSSFAARTQRITRALNLNLRSTDSSTANSFYVGSYGRNTAIPSLSDVDLLYHLPYALYSKYNAYLKARSFTWQGVRGTPRVLAAVGGVFALQLLFTYAPVMQQLFHTEALPLDWGLRIVVVGVGLLIMLELEKALLRRLGGWPGGGMRGARP